MPSLNDLKVVISTQADTKGISETETALGGLSTKTAAIMGAMAGVAQNLVFQGINLITSSVGDAISRVDTLNNSRRTFENMGFSAQATSKMMGELDQSIRGLPTRLNDAVSGVELLAGSTNDIDKSRRIFNALNDGVIGFGGSASMVNGTVVQLSQAFSNGRVDAQTWNSMIQNGMGPALDALARKMGLTIGQFKDGLSTGKISVGQFQDALIDLDTKGGGGMKSLNQIAHDSTSGISTGMANAKTAVTRGIADMIQAIGSANISGAISSVGKAFENLAKIVAGFVANKELHQWFNDLTSAVASFLSWFRSLPAVVQVAISPLVALAANVHNVSGFMRELIASVENLWRTFSQSTVAVILSNFFQQVMLPALRSIWAAITQNLMPALAQLWTAFMRLWNALQPGLIEVLKIVGAILGGLLLAAIWAVLSVLNVFIQVISGVVSAISNIIRWISNLISWFGNLVGMAWNAASGIAGAFSTVYGAIVGPFQSAWNVVSGIANRISGAFNSIRSVASGVSGALHAAHIPGFATGVTNFSGGMALVGENGPELVSLPRGSSVYTNGQSKGMAGGSSMHTETHIYGDIHLGDASAVETFFAKIDQDTKLASRGMTGNRGIR